MRRRPLLLSPAALLTAAAPAARAQGFPERPISMVTGYPPGGPTDIVARLLADRIAAHLGPNERIVVEIRPGAAGPVASEWLRRQPPDRRTIFVAETSSHAVAPNALVSRNRYNPVADFTHLGVIGAPPLVPVVSHRFPERNPL